MNTTVALNRRIARAPIWRVGTFSSISAAAATAAWALAAETAGVPMLAGNIGAQHADPIGPTTFAVTTAVFSLLGTLVAIVAARRSRRPVRTFCAVAVAVLGVSMLGPAYAGATALATKVTLCIAHLIAAAIVMPPLVCRLAVVPAKAARAIDDRAAAS